MTDVSYFKTSALFPGEEVVTVGMFQHLKKFGDEDKNETIFGGSWEKFG